MTETDFPRFLQASLTLSASLLEAHDEESILRAAMRAGCEALDADGCLFMPLDEFAQRLSPLEFGRAPSFDAERLNQPAQRQKCKLCETRRAGRECALLHGDPDSTFIHCVTLSAHGREAGLFSFLFSSRPRMDEAGEWFLAETMRLSGLALESRERGLRLQHTEYAGSLPALTEEMQSLLPQIEYRIVIEERARLAREIHDGLAQTLAFLKIEIGRAERMLEQCRSDQAARILKDSSRTIGDACLDARQAIENLRRAPDENLDAWLRKAAEDFELLSGLPVEVDLLLTHEFPLNMQAQMIRIVQEALTNVRKHAQASHVRLAAHEAEQETVIEVKDNGRGFDPSDPIAAARFGLRGMRERAESIGVDFQVTSHVGQGTTVCLHIPIWEGVKP